MVAGKFAWGEIKDHCKIYTVIIVVISLSIMPFTLTSAYERYVETMVEGQVAGTERSIEEDRKAIEQEKQTIAHEKLLIAQEERAIAKDIANIQEVLSSDFALAAPGTDAYSVVDGTSDPLRNAEAVARDLDQLPGCNATVRVIASDEAMLQDGSHHGTRIWGIHAGDELNVTNLAGRIVEGEYFDPQEEYTHEAASGRKEGSVLSDLFAQVPQLMYLRCFVICLSSLPIVGSVLQPLFAATCEGLQGFLPAIPGVGRPASVILEGLFPYPVLHPESPLKTMIYTVAMPCRVAIPMMRMVHEMPPGAEFPTVVVYGVKLLDMVYGRASKIPGVEQLAEAMLPPEEVVYPVLVGQSFAADHDIHPGDNILLTVKPFGLAGTATHAEKVYVSGIYDLGIPQLEKWTFFMPIESVREMKGYQDYTGTVVLVKGLEGEPSLDMSTLAWNDFMALVNPEFEERVRNIEHRIEYLEQRIGDIEQRIGDAEASIAVRIESLSTAKGMVRMTRGIAYIALATAVIAIGYVMSSTVIQKKQELGHLKAYGLRDTSAVGILLYQALFVGCLAALVGLLLLPIGRWGMVWYTSLRIPAISTGFIQTPLMLVEAIAIPIGATLIGAIVPSVMIARLTPMKAMME